jgi:hypothetical protein
MNWSPKANLRSALTPRDTTTKPQPLGSSSLLGRSLLKSNPNGLSLVKDNKGKGVSSETPKLNSRVQCFKCQGFGHVVSNSANKDLVIDGQEYVSEEEDHEKQIYEPNLDEFDYLDDDCASDPNFLG